MRLAELHGDKWQGQTEDESLPMKTLEATLKKYQQPEEADKLMGEWWPNHQQQQHQQRQQQCCISACRTRPVCRALKPAQSMLVVQ